MRARKNQEERTISMPFGTRLREERLRRHLSQEALAEALDLSVRSIRRWEQGRSLPQAFARLQLSRFFGLHPEALFEAQETQTPAVPWWGVPYPRNLFFTGRAAILTALHAFLSSHQEAASPPCACALWARWRWQDADRSGVCLSIRLGVSRGLVDRGRDCRDSCLKPAACCRDAPIAATRRRRSATGHRSSPQLAHGA